jgi:hypothetical protein
VTWIGNFSQQVKDLEQTLKSLGANEGQASQLYDQVVDKVAQAWDEYLNTQKKMSFGQVLQLRRLECCQYPGGEHFNGI